MIIEESSKVTVERGSKKVEVYHLYVPYLTPSIIESHLSKSNNVSRKHAVETTEMLDFLKEIVEPVPDPSAGGTIDLEAENAEAAAAKRKRGKAKKSGDGEGGGKKRRKKKGEEETAAEAEADEGEDDGMDEDERPSMSAASGSSGWKTRPREEAWRDDAPYVPE